VEQILFNLLNNARESLDERGQGGRLAVIARQSDGLAELIIADDGVGVPSEQRGRLFEPYNTSKEEGTGLGLYVARKLARTSGGDLQLCGAAVKASLLDPPPRTAFMLRLRLGEDLEARAPALPRPTPAIQSLDELVKRIDELWDRPILMTAFCDHFLVRHRLEALLEPLEILVRWEAKPRVVSAAEADLVLAHVNTAKVEPEQLIDTIGVDDDQPALILALQPWKIVQASRALALGCKEIVRLSVDEAGILAGQLSMLAVARDQRLQSEAMLLIKAWTGNQESLLASLPQSVRVQRRGEIVKALSEGDPTRFTAAVRGSPAFRRASGEILGTFGAVVDQVSEEVDCVLLEVGCFPGAGGALAETLASVPETMWNRVVVCAESLGVAELNLCLDGDVLAVLTGTHSAPDLFRARLSRVARSIRTRRRLETVLQLLMVHRTSRSATREQRRRILLLDDDPVIVKLVAKALEPLGHELFTTTSGEEAIDVLTSWPIDLLVADKNLPDVSGIEVVEVARQRQPNLAALIITGYASQASAEEAMQLGVADYLVKPFDVEDLLDKITKLLQRQGGQRRPRSRGVLLAVEDPAAITSLQQAFSRRGEQILGTGPFETIAAELNDEAVGLVVVDLDRPLSSDARRVVNEVRAARPDLVVLALSTRPDLKRTLDALHLGARGMLHKPLDDPARICQVVATACGEVCA
jgi:DNA-binding response OmpR family regulator